jgi:hypothetical protein
MTDRIPDEDEEAALLALIASEPVPTDFPDVAPDARHDDLVAALADTVRWYRAATLHRDRVARPFETELARVKQAFDEAVSPRDAEVDRLYERAKMLHAALYRLDETATVKLPHGEAWSTKTGGRREVVDKPRVIAWAKKHCPDAVKVDVLVSMLPKDADVPGTEITRVGRNYGVRL